MMMIKSTRAAVPLLGLMVGTCLAAEPLKLESENDKINYSVGYQMGGDFKRQNVEIKPDMLIQGIEDAIGGDKPLMTEKERRATLMGLAQRVNEEQKRKMQEQGAKALKAGEAFLAENAGKAGVKTLPSGLQYRILSPGKGASPKATDKVTVHYRGALIDGTEFDSSHSRGKPATFAVNQVIPGWTEALQLMKEGAIWELYIPPQLAYGKRGAGTKIPPDSTLTFEVQLLSIEK